MGESFDRKPALPKRFAVGKTTFEEKIRPRLTEVQLGPRIVAFTRSSADRLADDLIAESASAPPIPRVPKPAKPENTAAPTVRELSRSMLE